MCGYVFNHGQSYLKQKIKEISNKYKIRENSIMRPHTHISIIQICGPSHFIAIPLLAPSHYYFEANSTYTGYHSSAIQHVSLKGFLMTSPLLHAILTSEK